MPVCVVCAPLGCLEVCGGGGACGAVCRLVLQMPAGPCLTGRTADWTFLFFASKPEPPRLVRRGLSLQAAPEHITEQRDALACPPPPPLNQATPVHLTARC